MTARKQALSDLLAKVEAGGTPIQPYLFQAVFNNSSHVNCAGEAFSAYADGSLDAALALHNAVLPRWAVDDLSQNGKLAGHPWGIRLAFWDGSNPAKNKHVIAGWGRNLGGDYTPARVWLIAILEALIAGEDA